ncbi:cationic amino acid transporter 2, vacuolar-like [Hevea brasiliensis]|uniref:cationic amino acid transporter 2, vacuolar-like n=1 Tax=Hevea brasiliensis TaxID=3981 RepID=UPI0025CFF47F|nr:cationic amino acid transporter 2, vacuolar-like [Hevea brasiliensis]
MVPLPSSLQDTIDFVSLQYGVNSQNINVETSDVNGGASSTLPLLGKNNTVVDYPKIVKQEAQRNYVRNEENRRKIAGSTIAFTCIGAFLLTYAATDLNIPRWVDQE